MNKFIETVDMPTNVLTFKISALVSQLGRGMYEVKLEIIARWYFTKKVLIFKDYSQK